MVECSDKMWFTGEENGKPLQYSCHENPMNTMKRQKDRTLKDELPMLVQFSSVAQSCPILCDSINPARQASLSITKSRSLSKLMSIDLVMPSNDLILCHPLPLLPSIFPNIRVFSNEPALHIRWPIYWSFSFNMSPSNKHPGISEKPQAIYRRTKEMYLTK